MVIFKHMKKNIPITLLTGFLGSGKSTLINRILAELPHIRFGILLNEFGDVKLESQIVEASEEDIVELQNGCMCCVVRSDLMNTVRDLIARKPDLDHILVEASGLSDPLPIAQTFTMDTVEGQVRFSSVVCLVDSLNFSTNLQNFQVALQQLRYSDFVLLTKTDLAQAKDVTKIRESLKSLAPKAFVYSSNEAQLFSLILDNDTLDHSDLALLQWGADKDSPLGLSRDPQKSISGTKNAAPKGKFQSKGKVSSKHEAVDTFFYKTPHPLDFSTIGKILDNLPSNVVRSKGFLFLNTPESERVKVIFQSVALRNSLDVRPWSEGEEKQSALVFIGKGLDKPALQRQLESAEIRL